MGQNQGGEQFGGGKVKGRRNSVAYGRVVPGLLLAGLQSSMPPCSPCQRWQVHVLVIVIARYNAWLFAAKLGFLSPTEYPARVFRKLMSLSFIDTTVSTTSGIDTVVAKPGPLYLQAAELRAITRGDVEENRLDALYSYKKFYNATAFAYLDRI